MTDARMIASVISSAEICRTVKYYENDNVQAYNDLLQW